MAEGNELLPLYQGSCHCRFITYEARLDLVKPKPQLNNFVITKCNCSICHKTGAPLVSPVDGTFKLLTPPNGKQELRDYTFHDSAKIHHWFCPRCGIKVLIDGAYEYDGVEHDFQRINVLTLDSRDDGQPMDDLRKVKIGYYSGKANEWSKPIAAEPAEGGIW